MRFVCREGGRVTWTTEKPTMPGWYWYWTGEQGKDPCMARVFAFGGHMNAVWSDGRSEYVISMSGEWMGPLEP